MLRADLLTVVTRGADDKFFNPFSLGAQDNIDWAVVVSGRMRAAGRKASLFIKEGWTRYTLLESRFWNLRLPR